MTDPKRDYPQLKEAEANLTIINEHRSKIAGREAVCGIVFFGCVDIEHLDPDATLRCNLAQGHSGRHAPRR